MPLNLLAIWDNIEDFKFSGAKIWAKLPTREPTG